MNNQQYVGIAALINKLLRKVGLQVIRKESADRFDSLSSQMTHVSLALEKLRTESNDSARHSAVLELQKRIATLESKSQDGSLENAIRYAMKAHWRTIDILDKTTGSAVPTRCALCGFDGDESVFQEIVSQCVFQGGVLIRHQCPNCDVIFGPQKMLALDAESLDLEYRNLYRVYSEGDSTETIIRTFHLLKPRKDGIYLDFGCGGEWSDAIKGLRKEGWNLYGFEPSATHSSEFVFSKWSEVSALQFDGIYSHNVLEHLFHPADTTRRLKELLRKGGSIVHATPCFEYRYEYSHYHVFFFTGRSPDVLAHQAGMEIVDWVRDGDFIACVLGQQ